MGMNSYELSKGGRLWYRRDLSEVYVEGKSPGLAFEVKIEIDKEVILNLVAEHIRSHKIGILEGQTTEEILGLTMKLR